MMVSIQDEYAANDANAPKARLHRALNSCALFTGASRATLEAVVHAATLEEVSEDRPIVQQGITAQSVAVIARGRARVERSLPAGHVMPLGYRGVGDLVSESCLAGAEVYQERVVAMDDSVVTRIPIGTMNALLRQDPAVAHAFAALVLARQAETEERIASLLFRTVEGRVAEFLLDAAERWGVSGPQGTLISAPVTHAEIARLIGSTRETVTVTLGLLRRDGLLTTSGRRLIVVSREGLVKRK